MEIINLIINIGGKLYENIRIFTGCYDNCKNGNLVSISGDKGRSVGFNGNSYTKLAPKKVFGVYGIIT